MHENQDLQRAVEMLTRAEHYLRESGRISLANRAGGWLYRLWNILVLGNAPMVEYIR